MEEIGNYRETKTRIGVAFRELRKQKVVALQNHLCCMSCASSSLSTRLEEKDRDKLGAVYFHAQDEDSLKWSGEIHIRYFANDTKESGKPETVRIGQMAKDALKFAGLEVKWDGDPGSTIVAKLPKHWNTCDWI